jgi:uncharacterized membrane protein
MSQRHRLLHDPVKHRSRIRSFKAKISARRTVLEKFADFLTSSFGTVTFLVINAAIFAAWIAWNTGQISGLRIVDPFPFGLLTMAVSLEAIMLAIIVLISQNREARIADLREEVELYINTYSEYEITKAMYILTLIAEKNGIDLSNDPDLDEMLGNIESDEVERELEKQLAKI